MSPEAVRSSPAGDRVPGRLAPPLSRSPRFLVFVAGQTVSQFGDRLTQLALVAILGALGASTAAAVSLSELAIVMALPVILLGPIAGVLVDRWNRRTTLVACDLARALLVVSLPAARAVSPSLTPVFAVVFLLFLVTMVANAAKMAVIPDLVDSSALRRANAACTMAGRVATFAGIAAGGLVIEWRGWHRLGWQGSDAAFYLDAGSFALAALTLAVAVPGGRVSPHPAPRGATTSRGELPDPPPALPAPAVWSELREGWRAVRGDRRVGFVLATVGLVAVMSGAAYVLGVVLIQTVLGLGVRGLGFIGGVGAVGMVSGAWLAATALGHLRHHVVILAGCAAAGLLAMGVAGASGFAGAAGLAFLIGGSLAPVAISQDTWLHETLPPEVRGRVFAMRDLLNNAAGALGAVVATGAVAAGGAAGLAQPYRSSLLIFGAVLAAAAAGAALWCRSKGFNETRVDRGS